MPTAVNLCEGPDGVRDAEGGISQERSGKFLSIANVRRGRDFGVLRTCLRRGRGGEWRGWPVALVVV